MKRGLMMDRVYTEGNTIFNVILTDDAKIKISVLSKRAYNLAIKKSRKNEWIFDLFELIPEMVIDDRIVVKAYNLQLGCFVAVFG